MSFVSYKEWRIAMFKKSYLFLLILILLSFACTREKKPLEPEKPSAIPSTMPQVDIPWPSLAKSPWSLSHRTPQCVARTRLLGPRTGQILWHTPVPRGKALSPPVIGEDGTIYVSVNVAGYPELPLSGLYAISPNGEIKWQFTPPNHLKNEQLDGSPMIGADGTIYVASWGNRAYSFFYALHPDGTVKWVYKLEAESVEGGNNIGLDGTLYTVTMDGHLHAINPDGTRKWKAYGLAGFQSEPSGSISISPDGRTLYLGGLDRTLNAVNAADGSMKWRKITGLDYNRVPMIDFQGHIYCQAIDSLGHYVFSLDPEGRERWRFKISTSTFPVGLGSDFVMDWDGFLYVFSGSGIYSLDYSGHLRWEKDFGGTTDLCPLLCDGENVIYGLANNGIIKGFGQDGSLRFQITSDEHGATIGAIGENGVLYFISSEPTTPRRYKALFAVK